MPRGQNTAIWSGAAVSLARLFLFNYRTPLCRSTPGQTPGLHSTWNVAAPLLEQMNKTESEQNKNNQWQTNERFNVGFSSGHGIMTSGGWCYLECCHTVAKGRPSAPFFSGNGTLQQAAPSLCSCCSLVTDWMCVLSYWDSNENFSKKGGRGGDGRRIPIWKVLL